MNHFGISFDVKNVPVLNPHFVPIAAFNRAYAEKASLPFAVAVHRTDDQCFAVETKIIGTEDSREADNAYAERLVKLLLWAVGGYRVTVCGSADIAAHIQKIYNPGGTRAFDVDFMQLIYERPFEVCSVSYQDRPQTREDSSAAERSLKGCRIGFDAGGSDRKVSAVIDGDVVYSEEVVWNPKITTDPQYHYDEILSAFKTAASKMPRVDAIGVSSAGIYINDETRVASLFRAVARDDFERVVKTIYKDTAKAMGDDIRLKVANDGDVTALAGAMELKDGCVLGIAMGTSLAAGYVDRNENILGRLNELAFAPLDGQKDGAEDDWSGDLGCGVKYLSQDAVSLLAPHAGIKLPEGTPAERLKFVQGLMEKDDPAAVKVFESIGCYLGHALPLYRTVYDYRYVLLLGRVMSGKGGDTILRVAKNVLREDYPEVTDLTLHLPDEHNRRVGQSIAAASLPQY